MRSAIALTLLLAAAARAEEHDDDADLDALLAPQSSDDGEEGEAPASDAPIDVGTASVRVTLPAFAKVWAALQGTAAPPAPAAGARPVILGEAHYEGRALPGALALRVRLSATLGAGDAWKTVPLVGDDVVLVGAAVDGKPIGVTPSHGYQVWTTRRSGEVAVDLELRVPAKGPPGSTEYSFRVVRTPVTRLTCRFPGVGIEPRLDAAAQSAVTTEGGETVLDAVLSPVTRLHLVSVADLGGAGDTPARMVAETLSLLSIDRQQVQVFSILRYRILAGRAHAFEIELPPGARVIAAEGRGGFHYQLEGNLLRGETAFPIRDRYEISLRLAREQGDGAFAAPLPRPRGVERELGWLAVEVPGKAQLEEVSRAGPSAIDARQLPPDLVQSAVAPILRAYRYHEAAALELRAVRLPEQQTAGESIDRVRAFTTVSAEGTLLTEMRLVLKNRLRQSVALALPAASLVRSTLLDGRPVKPSRNAAGQLVLPLERSPRVHGRLQPITVHVVFEEHVAPLDLAGRRELRLPAVDLPVSSLAWSVFLPDGNVYTELSGPVGAQRQAGQGQWMPPTASPDDEAADAGAEAAAATPGSERLASVDTGAMPVRIELPKGGVRLEHERYWLAPGEPARVSLGYLRRPLTHPVAFLLGLLVVAAVRTATGPRRGRRLVGLGAALLAVWLLGRLTGGRVAAVVACTALLVALHPRRLRAFGAGVVRWARTLPERWRAHREETTTPPPRRVWRTTLATLLVLASLLLAGQLLALAAQLGGRLG